MTPTTRYGLFIGTPLLLVLLLVQIFGGEADELAAYRDFPHTMIAIEDMGYDTAKIKIWRGDVQSPTQVEIDGVMCYPAYYHPEASVIPQRAGGHPLIFPVVPVTNKAGEVVGLTTPRLPPSGRQLTMTQIEGEVRRFHVPEGEQLLAQFAAERAEQ